MEKLKFKQHYNPGEVIINKKQIATRLREVGSEIARDYENKDLVIVPILKGAHMVGADLQREIFQAGHKNHELSFTMIQSYEGTQSTGKIKVIFDTDIDPKGKNILLVDDIIDKGYSLQYLDNHMKEKGAASVRSFAFLSKLGEREVNIEADYVGYEIPNLWVEGYGMDSDGWGRGNPHIVMGPTKPL